MYKKGDIVITTKPVSVGYGENKKVVIPENEEVKLLKVFDNDDLSQTKVAIQPVDSEEDFYIIKEVNIKPVDDKLSEQAIKEVNIELYKKNPRLRVYHFNPIKRIYFKIMYFFIDLKANFKNKLITMLGGKIEE